MRASLVSLLLAGGVIALGGCSTTVEPGSLTLAERTEQCRGIGGNVIPTGRETGDVRQDYRCRGGHARANRESSVDRSGSLSAAVDRSLRRGY